jgi:copper chaperone CopZ
MRKLVFMMAACLAIVCNAKDIKTVVLTTSPQMHCQNCENKIKSNIRFEKGVKDIVTDLDTKTVTIKYDADKTTVENIVAGFAKIDYTATVVDGNNSQAQAAAPQQEKKSSCCGSGSCKCGSGAAGGCGGCGSKAAAPAAQGNDKVAYFKAEQMSCGGCANKVKTNISAEEGVKDVAVNLDTKVVSITYDSTVTDSSKLIDGFKKFDYNVVEVNN